MCVLMQRCQLTTLTTVAAAATGAVSSRRGLAVLLNAWSLRGTHTVLYHLHSPCHCLSAKARHNLVRDSGGGQRAGREKHYCDKLCISASLLPNLPRLSPPPGSRPFLMDDIIPWYGRDCRVRIWSARTRSLPVHPSIAAPPSAGWQQLVLAAGSRRHRLACNIHNIY